MPRYKSYDFMSRGVTLRARKWWPDSGYPRAVVLCLHSWGDHSGRFEAFARYLTGHGYAVYTFDFEGHGESPGHRAHIGDFDAWIADLTGFVGVVQNELRSVPMFLCGYSVGGLVAATYLSGSHLDIDGVIFNASALAEGRGITPVKRLAASMIGGLAPRLGLSQITFGHQMSRDPAEVAAFDDDPLIHHGKMDAGTGKALLNATARIGKLLERIEIPLLIIHGTADPLADPASAKALHEWCRGIDKTLKLYEGAMHDLFHEINRDEVFADVRQWLDTRAGKGW